MGLYDLWWSGSVRGGANETAGTAVVYDVFYLFILDIEEHPSYLILKPPHSVLALPRKQRQTLR